MGWTSFLEDIEKRLEDSIPRLQSSAEGGSKSNVGIDGLRETNASLRAKNAELLKLIVGLRDEISSRKQTDFCKQECVRLKKVNFDLASRLKYLQESEAPLNIPSRKVASTSRSQTDGVRNESRPNKVNPSPEHVKAARQRLQTAQKTALKAKEDMKIAQRAYERIIQSERNSIQHIHSSGIIRSDGNDLGGRKKSNR